MDEMKKDVAVDSGQMAVFPAYKVVDGEYVGCVKAKKGADYLPFVELENAGELWGERVKRLVVFREDAIEKTEMLASQGRGLQPLGRFTCTEDSLFVSDPCYVFDDEYGDGGPYDRACDANFDRNGKKRVELQAGIFRSESGYGVSCRSGFGDGLYEMTATMDEHGARRIEVVFIDDEDEEEE